MEEGPKRSVTNVEYRINLVCFQPLELSPQHNRCLPPSLALQLACLQLWSSPPTGYNPFLTSQHCQDKVQMLYGGFPGHICPLAHAHRFQLIFSLSPPLMGIPVPVYCKHHTLLLTPQPFLLPLPRELFPCPSVFLPADTYSFLKTQLRYPPQQEASLTSTLPLGF